MWVFYQRSIIIKRAEKNKTVAIYLSEAYQLLQSHHYKIVDGFNCKVLRNIINDNVIRMHIYNGIDEISFKYLITEST